MPGGRLVHAHCRRDDIHPDDGHRYDFSGALRVLLDQSGLRIPAVVGGLLPGDLLSGRRTMVGRSLHRQGILDCIAGPTGEGESSRVRMGGARASGADLSKTPTNLVAHLFAELLPAGGCLSFSGILNRSKTSNFS